MRGKEGNDRQVLPRSRRREEAVSEPGRSPTAARKVMPQYYPRIRLVTSSATPNGGSHRELVEKSNAPFLPSSNMTVSQKWDAAKRALLQALKHQSAQNQVISNLRLARRLLI